MFGKEQAQHRNVLRKSELESQGGVQQGNEDRKGVGYSSSDGLNQFTWPPGLLAEARPFPRGLT